MYTKQGFFSKTEDGRNELVMWYGQSWGDVKFSGSQPRSNLATDSLKLLRSRKATAVTVRSAVIPFGGTGKAKITLRVLFIFPQNQ